MKFTLLTQFRSCFLRKHLGTTTRNRKNRKGQKKTTLSNSIQSFLLPLKILKIKPKLKQNPVSTKQYSNTWIIHLSRRDLRFEVRVLYCKRHFYQRRDKSVLIYFSNHSVNIEVTWCKNYLLVMKATNRYRIEDRKVELWKKVCTFEGPAYLSAKESLNSPKLNQRLMVISNSIIDHLKAISGDQIQIRKMVLHFRVDHQQKIWLTYCKRIVMQKKEIKHSEDDQYVQMSIKRPKNIPTIDKYTKEVKLFRGRMVIEQKMAKENCPGCLKIHRLGLYPLKVKYLISSYLSGNKLTPNLRNFARITILHKLPLRNKYEPQSHEKFKNEMEEMNKDVIPGILKWLFDVKDLKELALDKCKNASFLDIDVFVCEDCILNFTNVQMDCSFRGIEPCHIRSRSLKLLKHSKVKNNKKLRKVAERVPLILNIPPPAIEIGMIKEKDRVDVNRRKSQISKISMKYGAISRSISRSKQNPKSSSFNSSMSNKKDGKCKNYMFQDIDKKLETQKRRLMKILGDKSISSKKQRNQSYLNKNSSISKLRSSNPSHSKVSNKSHNKNKYIKINPFQTRKRSSISNTFQNSIFGSKLEKKPQKNRFSLFGSIHGS